MDNCQIAAKVESEGPMTTSSPDHWETWKSKKGHVRKI